MLELMNWNGIDVIDSRVVAEAVGKEHKELMRTIRTYIHHLAESNFGLSGNSPLQSQNLAERKIALSENSPSQNLNLTEAKSGPVENSPSQSQNLGQLNFESSEFFIETIGGTGNE